MNLKKIGDFLRNLRKEKGITQEDLAEKLLVSRRTVSRWETGSNMPDLVLLIELADFYEVELRELLNGERRSDKMDKELEDTVLKVADYSNEEKNVFRKSMHILNIIAFIGLTLHFLIKVLGLEGHGPYDLISGLGSGFAYGMLIMGILFNSRYELKLRKFKHKLLKKGGKVH